MKRGIILHKTAGKLISAEYLKNCLDHSSSKIGILYWEPGVTPIKVDRSIYMSFDALKGFLEDKQKYEVIVVFNDRHPATLPDIMPYSTDETGSNYLYYAHSGELLVTSSANEDKAFFDAFINPIIGPEKLKFIDSLDQQRYGNFITVSLFGKKFAIIRFGEWHEEDGVYYSDICYRQKKTSPYYHQTNHTPPPLPKTSAKTSGANEKNDVDIDKSIPFLGLEFRNVTPALRGYFKLPKNIKWYIAHPKREFKAIDFIESISGSEEMAEKNIERIHVKYFADKRDKSIHLRVRRYDMIRWSQTRSSDDFTNIHTQLSPIYLDDDSRHKLEKDLLEKSDKRDIYIKGLSDLKLLKLAKESNIDLTEYFA